MTELPEAFPLTSLDIAAEKRDQLRRCLAAAFPEIMAEDKIDLDQLRRVLGEWVEPDRERFGLNWPGKAACMKVIQAPSVGTLKPCRADSVDWDTTENVFIEGDNLEVLKLLQKAYFGKVKMIYIDPPYNTGEEFIYPDNYAENLDTYLAYTGQKDAGGRSFSTNKDSAGRYHSRWLNMMYPRLYLAKNLMSDDGVIWVSIDDNELQNVIHLCGIIFGEENFVSSFVWQKRKTRENRKVFSTSHDYIVCFARNKSSFEKTRKPLPLTDEVRARYRNLDNDPRGDWQSVSLNAQAGHGTKSQFYSITLPSGRLVEPPPGRCWTVTEARLKELIADNRIWFGETGDNAPRLKHFLDEEEGNGLTPHTLWLADEVGTTDSAKKALMELFQGAAVFDTPKPVDLIERIAQISNVDGGIVMDFFAGSMPLAEACFKLAAQENIKTKFIAIQLPEPVEPGSEPWRFGAKTVSDISIERIKRAAGQFSGNRPGELELGSFERTDLGVRKFKLDRSNFRSWDGHQTGDDQLEAQLELHIDHVAKESSAEDILYELLLKDGFPLATPIETLTLAGKEVFSIADGALLICLDKALTQEVIDAMADREPHRVICLDSGFQGNDQLKANAVQTFKARARNSETAIEFRTV